MVFTRIILFIIGVVGGACIIKYREKIARLFGKSDLAEKYLGSGGTYNMWILIGVVTMILGLLVLMGKFSAVGV